MNPRIGKKKCPLLAAVHSHTTNTLPALLTPEVSPSNSDTNCLELGQTPEGKGLVPQDCP